MEEKDSKIKETSVKFKLPLKLGTYKFERNIEDERLYAEDTKWVKFTAILIAAIPFILWVGFNAGIFCYFLFALIAVGACIFATIKIPRGKFGLCLIVVALILYPSISKMYSDMFMPTAPRVENSLHKDALKPIVGLAIDDISSLKGVVADLQSFEIKTDSTNRLMPEVVAKIDKMKTISTYFYDAIKGIDYNNADTTNTVIPTIVSKIEEMKTYISVIEVRIAEIKDYKASWDMYFLKIDIFNFTFSILPVILFLVGMFVFYSKAKLNCDIKTIAFGWLLFTPVLLGLIDTILEYWLKNGEIQVDTAKDISLYFIIFILILFPAISYLGIRNWHYFDYDKEADKILKLVSNKPDLFDEYGNSLYNK